MNLGKLRTIVSTMLVITLIVTFSPTLVTARQSEENTATELVASMLPLNTLLFVEMPHQDLPASVDILMNLFTPNGEFAADSLLVATPYSSISSWVGQQAAFALFLPNTSQSLEDFIPRPVMFLQIGDELAADTFFESTFDNSWRIEQRANTTRWTQQVGGFGVSVVRMPGYVVVGTNTAIDEVLAVIFQDEERIPWLWQDENFRNMVELRSSDTLLWAFSRPLGMATALIADANSLNIDLMWQGRPLAADEVPATLSADALAGVPPNAILVDAGTNADLILQNQLDMLQPVLAILTQFDPRLSDLSLQVQLMLDMLLMPALNGSYAGYVAVGTGQSLINSGLLLAPDGGDLPTITQNIDQLREMTGLPVHVLTDPLDESILDTPQWGRVLEAAPSGTQHLMYLNIQEVVRLVISGLDAVPQLRAQSLTAALQYAKRYESAVVFFSDSADGLHWRRFSLILRW